MTILVWLMAGPCAAQSSATADDVFTQDLPLVLTASRLSQPVSEAPSAVTIIDRNMIVASGFRTVPELLRLVPGMYVGFADANRPVVSRNGSADEYARRMQVLIDGRSAYLPPFGGVHWADLPLLTEDIERIEVVRGPSSASYGSNSFYGVINIISREAADQPGASLSTARGHASDLLARFGQTGSNFDYRVSLGYRSDLGLDNFVLNDFNNTRVFNFRGNYHPTATDNLDVQLGSSDGIYGLGIEGRPEDAFRDTRAKSDFQQLRWLHVWPSGNETKLTYSRASRRSRDPYICVDGDLCQGNNPGDYPPDGFKSSEVVSQRNELEIQNTTQLGTHNRLVWGANVRNDFADFPLLFSHPYTVNPWQFFVHDEIRLGSAAVLNIGTMLEDDGMGNRNNSPRVALNYHLAPGHTLRLGSATATRSPVMAEAFIAADNTIWGGGYVGPVKPLTAERVTSREIGYVGEFRARGLSIEARLYEESVRNLIWWDKCSTLPPCADSFGNLLAAQYQGVEVTAKLRWDEGRSFLIGNYAHQRASATLDGQPTQYADPGIGDAVKAYYGTEYFNQFAETVPANNASLLLSLALNNAWRFSAGYYYRDMVRIMNVSPDVTPETTMHRLDLRLSKTVKVEKGGSAEFALVVQNALQDAYTKYGTVNRVSEVPFFRRAWLTAVVNF